MKKPTNNRSLPCWKLWRPIARVLSTITHMDWSPHQAPGKARKEARVVRPTGEELFGIWIDHPSSLCFNSLTTLRFLFEFNSYPITKARSKCYKLIAHIFFIYISLNLFFKSFSLIFLKNGQLAPLIKFIIFEHKWITKCLSN